MTPYQLYRARRLELILRRRRMNALARRLGYRNYAEYCND